MDQRGYQDAAAVLPLRLRREAMALPEERQALAEELRLRVGRAMTVLLPEGEVPFAVTVEQEDLEGLCNIASDFSRYAAAESLRKGYLSVRGGCRVGLCGSAILKEGETAGLRDFSSAAIRILVNSSATSVNCHPASPVSAVIARNTPQRSEQMLFIRPLGTSARTRELNSAAAHRENKYRRIASITRSPPSKSMPPRQGSSKVHSLQWPSCSPWRRRGLIKAPRGAS